MTEAVNWVCIVGIVVSWYRECIVLVRVAEVCFVRGVLDERMFVRGMVLHGIVWYHVLHTITPHTPQTTTDHRLQTTRHTPLYTQIDKHIHMHTQKITHQQVALGQSSHRLTIHRWIDII